MAKLLSMIRSGFRLNVFVDKWFSTGHSFPPKNQSPDTSAYHPTQSYVGSTANYNRPDSIREAHHDFSW